MISTVCVARRLVLWATIGLNLVVFASAGGAKTHTAPAYSAQFNISLFQMPAMAQELKALEQMIRTGDYDQAETAIRDGMGSYSGSPAYQYLLAAILAGQNRHSAALDRLDTAIALGLQTRTARLLEEQFTTLFGDSRYVALQSKIGSQKDTPPEGTATPSAVSGQTAVVSSINTRWETDSETLHASFRFSAPKPAAIPVQTADDRSAQRLNTLYYSGKAAGNHRDLYDNRDGGHSTVKRKDMPQLTFVEYGIEARAARIQSSINPGILYNAITFGNSSMAIRDGPFWRSLPRQALTQPGGATRLYRQYAGNHLYIYPEHRDHDPEFGDLFPANTPYLLIAQGSSKSDKPLMRAVASILAAFKPEVKDFLREHGLVMPIVQMIFRRGMDPVSDDAAYLSGAAHPSVFEGSAINLFEMIARANQLNLEDVPPMVRLSVLEETAARPELDSFSPQSETLFDTPSAVARIVRSTVFSRQMRVSAADTVDPNGRKLTFHWIVLRGDADRIEITAQNDDASTVELTVPWHDQTIVPGRSDLVSHRVDIGVFAYNGVHYSAPAFISFYFPPNERREYDADGRIRFVDYRTPAEMAHYADPEIFPLRDWADRYAYDPASRLIGWTRTRSGEKSAFTRHGTRVMETDTLGRPLKAAVIGYRLETGADGMRHIVEYPTKEVRIYKYADDDDRQGRATPGWHLR